MRASHVALLRQGARGVHPQQENHRLEQDSPHRGRVCPPPAGAGAHDHPNQGVHPAHAQPHGRDGHHRGAAPVHADARRGETTLHHHDLGLHGRVPAGEDPRGIHEPDTQQVAAGRFVTAHGIHGFYGFTRIIITKEI